MSFYSYFPTWGTPAPIIAPLWIIGPSFPTNKPEGMMKNITVTEK